MKIKSLFIGLGMLTPVLAWPCTSLIAGKKATADGSVLVTYAADSHTLYGELYHSPAADHAPGSMRKVYEWDTGKYLGEIPQVAHTYSTVGNTNEHGLTIAESTWGGRPELNDTTGIIDYGSLIYITLERAKTAREALDVMTSLVKDYGYHSSGESFTIADPNEAWVMELIGKGGKEKGAVWVARRIPDDCISGHANHPRIHQFPLNDKENTIYSPDVIDFARKQGYYKGKDKDFSFSLAYGELDGTATRGCDGRVWSYFNRFTDGMDKYLPWVMEADGDPFPLWVKPDRQLTLGDMRDMMRDHFEGTPMDMTQDIGAGPYKVPYRWRPMTFKVDGKEYLNERAIATQQTGFSFVSQMNEQFPDAMKGILWFGVDDANTCVYVPMYCTITQIPYEFAPGNGDMLTLSWDAAFWVNNYVANQAYNRYSQMIPDIRRVQQNEESTLDNEVQMLLSWVKGLSPEEARKMVNNHSLMASTRYLKNYKALGDYLLVKYLDGNVKKEKDGKFERTPEGVCVSPSFPGYDERYYRSIVEDAGDRLLIKEPKKK
ncbi:dipeptidase [uncultured Duncaniella sp.]|uniref:dipeptidase n=1 Tax=uncultured Duncaniella sp. TaxID=2768039 RepID=UPI00267708C9|nr:C69 family dipeptidase [uncultured Duncaniella sp.]MCI9173248.1 dipeptidase [Muribaculaceae bacterium]